MSEAAVTETCVHGHGREHMRTFANGTRRCLACRRDRQRRRRDRQRAEQAAHTPSRGVLVYATFAAQRHAAALLPPDCIVENLVTKVLARRKIAPGGVLWLDGDVFAVLRPMKSPITQRRGWLVVSVQKKQRQGQEPNQ